MDDRSLISSCGFKPSGQQWTMSCLELDCSCFNLDDCSFECSCARLMAGCFYIGSSTVQSMSKGVDEVIVISISF